MLPLVGLAFRKQSLDEARACRAAAGCHQEGTHLAQTAAIPHKHQELQDVHPDFPPPPTLSRCKVLSVQRNVLFVLCTSGESKESGTGLVLSC